MPIGLSTSCRRWPAVAIPESNWLRGTPCREWHPTSSSGSVMNRKVIDYERADSMGQANRRLVSPPRCRLAIRTHRAGKHSFGSALSRRHSDWLASSAELPSSLPVLLLYQVLVELHRGSLDQNLLAGLGKGPRNKGDQIEGIRSGWTRLANVSIPKVSWQVRRREAPASSGS